MTQSNKVDPMSDQIKELEEDNELLVLQLRQAQEELQKYYRKYTELEKTQLTSGGAPIAEDESVVEMLSEIERLRVLSETQEWVNRSESDNALHARLGRMIVDSASSAAGIMSVPSKLIKFWRSATNTSIPSQLGGEDFSNVIAAYQKSGIEGANSLIADAQVPQQVAATALTKLARHLMKDHKFSDAVKVSEEAFRIDPKGFRLKWLAFRFHDAGDVIKAESIVQLLPAETSFTDSESKQVDQIKFEAQRERTKRAKAKTGFNQKKQQRERELQELKQTLAAVEGEKTQLQSRAEAQAGQLQEQERELGAIKLNEQSLASDKLRLEEQLTQLERQRSEQTATIEQRERELQELKQTLAAVEADKTQLQSRAEAQAEQLQDRERELGAIKLNEQSLASDKLRLEEQLTQLERQRSEQTASIEQRERELQELKQTLAAVEGEKTQLQSRAEAQAEQLQERERELNVLRVSEQKLQTVHANQQQKMQEEIVRAEAQIDLIKEMVLREDAL
jgi:hypothetical protein